MNSLLSIIAFLLSEHDSKVDYVNFTQTCINVSGVLEQYEITPFQAFWDGESTFSFSIDHMLGQLANKGLIGTNGCIIIHDKNGLQLLAKKLNFDLQLALRGVLKKTTTFNYSTSKYVVPTANISFAPANIVYTIGYEGKTIESLFSTLIKAGVKTLVDVRKNAISRKFGFSKKQLNLAAQKLSVEYIHIPEMGIPSDSRQELSKQSDYDLLFSSYVKTILPQYESKQLELITLLKQQPAALMCYEANIKQCHRIHLAKHLGQKGSMKIINI